MNLTQENITTTFTISHARNTIEDLIENTKREMQNTDRRKPIEREYYLKLQKIFFTLEKSLVQIRDSEMIINNIDSAG